MVLGGCLAAGALQDWEDEERREFSKDKSDM